MNIKEKVHLISPKECMILYVIHHNQISGKEYLNYVKSITYATCVKEEIVKKLLLSMEENGLVERKLINYPLSRGRGHPPSAIWSITPKGKRLLDLYRRIMEEKIFQ